MARLTIRGIKLAVETTIATAAISGSVILILGSASCFLGLTGAAAIKLGELLAPHRNTLKTMMIVGGAGTGTGLFLIGAGAAIARLTDDWTEELFAPEETEPTINRTIPDACLGCKHYHGSNYNGVQFVCAMHPYGSESDNCPDRESY